MPVTHFSKITRRGGTTHTGTLCGRMTSGEINCTAVPAEVTCKLCRRQAEATKLWADSCRADRDPPAEAPAPAKLGIENIYVHTGGLGGQASVHWTIGARRFHVWMRENDRKPEDVVHSNPVTPTPNSRRDEHRSLDRTCKAQAAIWSEVWSIVERDDLIAKCRIQDKAHRARELRLREVGNALAEINASVIEAWRSGTFSASPLAAELLASCALLEAERNALSAPDLAELEAAQ